MQVRSQGDRTLDGPGWQPGQMTASPGIPAGLSPYETALQLRTWTLSANGYSRDRKARFRLFSTGTKVLSLVLSGAATIILGLQNLTFWAGLGFSLVALTTTINAIEPFFNWRSRWVLAEEAQHRFYRLQEDLEYLVATRRPDELMAEDLEKLYVRYQEIWDHFAGEWLEHRRRASGAGAS
jgi:hypothetical protein